MKKAIYLLLIAMLIFVLSGVSVAGSQPASYKAAGATPQTFLYFQVDNTNYKVGLEEKMLDAAPFIRENRTLIPIRYVIEALGGTVGWNNDKKEVSIDLRGTIIKLWINKSTAEVNGASFPIDSTNPKVVPIIEKGRTFIPLRFVLEAINAEVIWHPTDKIIAVRYPWPGYLTYNNANFGIRIKYPDNWLKDEGTSTVPICIFTAPEKNNLRVAMYDLSSAKPTPTLNDFTATYISLLKNTPDTSILEQKQATLAGVPSNQIVFRIKNNGVDYKVMIALTVKNSRGYALTYSSEAGAYSNHLMHIQQMISSFETY